MKTLHILSLLLQRLCNQKSISGNKKRHSKWLLFSVIVFIFMFLTPVQNAKGAQSLEIFYNYYTIKTPQYNTTSPLTTVDIRFMFYSFVDNYNCARNLTVSYLSPADNKTYIKLFDYSYGESNNQYGFTNNSYNIVSGPFNTVGSLSTLTNETVYFPANAYFKAGYYMGATAKWDFPPCLIGKTITLKVEGLWQEMDGRFARHLCYSFMEK